MWLVKFAPSHIHYIICSATEIQAACTAQTLVTVTRRVLAMILSIKSVWAKVALMLLSTHRHKKQDYLICYNGALHCKSVEWYTHAVSKHPKKHQSNEDWCYLKIWESPFLKKCRGGYSILSDTAVKLDTCQDLGVLTIQDTIEYHWSYKPTSPRKLTARPASI